jgi:hypothetical protein
MLVRAVILAAILAVAGGCTSRPVVNVVAEPVVVTPGKTATDDNVRDAIMRAGAGLGCTMRPTAPGVVNGTLNLRTHGAVVDVEYNPKTYNMVYRSSTNLDAQGSQIHKNYNGWIENLNHAIRRELLRV